MIKGKKILREKKKENNYLNIERIIFPALNNVRKFKGSSSSRHLNMLPFIF